MNVLREIVAVGLAYVGLVVALRLYAGCKEAETVGGVAAEAAYTAAILRCVDEASTLEESKACREHVNRRWGITEKEAQWRLDGGAR